MLLGDVAEGTPVGRRQVEKGLGLTINCDLCTQQGTSVCEDCVVTFLCRDNGSAVVIDLGDVRALRTLQKGGLAPVLRHEPAAGETSGVGSL
jgi:hypothetical protein